MAHDTFIKAPNFVRLFFREFDDSSLAEQLQSLLFFFFSSFMLLGALVWGFLCLGNGMRMPSLIPFGYVILTLFNFLFLGSSNHRTRVGCNIQIAASLVLPFVFQHALGGIAASGIVMLWSLLALLGSLILQDKKNTFIWIGLFLGMTVASFYLEGLRPEESVSQVPILLTAVNVILVSIMIFALSNYFASMQKHMAKLLSEQKMAIRSANEMIKSELATAKSFQEVFHAQNSLNSTQYRHFQVSKTSSGVNGNFIWSGELGDCRVTVFIDNPCSGLRGSLESMFLWNLIDTGVFKLRKNSPQELIEHVQFEVSKKYTSPEIRNGMKEIGAIVLYHDTITNQLYYAAMDTTFILGNSEEQRTICGFKMNTSESVLSSTGVYLSTGSVILEPGMRAVMCNKALLNSWDITDAEELLHKTKGLQFLFSQDVRLAEKNLLRDIAKLDIDEDIFLQCIEF